MEKKKSEFIDVKGTLLDYLKHWWWFAISVVLCLAIGFCATRIAKQKSAVSSSIVITDDDAASSLSMMGEFSSLLGASSSVEDEVFVVASHSVLRNVARDLGINKLHYVRDGFLSYSLRYPKYPVDVYAEPALIDTLMTSIVFKTKVYADGTADVTAKARGNVIADVDGQKLPVSINTSYGRFVINTTPAYAKGEEVKSRITLCGYDVAAEALSEDVDCYMPSKRSNVIYLDMNTENSAYGEDVLNEIVKKYNERGIEEKNRQGKQTLAFLDERLALISGDLSTAESNIQNYQEKQGIVDVVSEASYNYQVKGTAEQALVMAQTNSEIVKMTRDFLTQPQNAYELIPASGVANIENDASASSSMTSAAGAIAAYNAMILRHMELKQTAKSDNKQLKQLEAQIDAMRKSINTTLNRAYQTSLVAIRDAKAEVAKAEGKLGNIPSQEREFLGLKRQQQVKQQLYLFLLQRREETAMLIANAVPKGQIIDRAYTLSEPVGMSKMAIMLVALLFGLVLPILALYMARVLRTKFETRKELEQLTGLPILGEICVDNSGKHLVVGTTNTSSTSELFRLVRTSLQFMLNEANDKVVLVTSTRSGEGKSFISVNTAASLALLGKKVLLIGMDIRSPRLHEYLGFENKVGLTTYLSNHDVSLDDMIICEQLGVNGLDVLLGGPVPPNPGELLTSKKVAEMFAELRSRYDFIVVDSAPVGMVSDTFNIVRYTDATMYVCRANYSTKSDINFVNQLQADRRLNKLALVMNGTKTVKGYGYGYSRRRQS